MTIRNLLLTCLLAALALAGTAHAQGNLVAPRPDSTKFIKFIAPNKESKWVKGKPHTVNWVSNTADSLQLDLYRGSTLYGTIAYSLGGKLGEGNFEWALPKELPTGNNFRMELVGMGNKAIKGSSEPFSIRHEFRGRRIALVVGGAVLVSAVGVIVARQLFPAQTPNLPEPPDPDQ